MKTLARFVRLCCQIGKEEERRTAAEMQIARTDRRARAKYVFSNIDFDVKYIKYNTIAITENST